MGFHSLTFASATAALALLFFFFEVVAAILSNRVSMIAVCGGAVLVGTAYVGYSFLLGS